MENSVLVAVRVPVSAGSLGEMDPHAGTLEALSHHHGLRVGHCGHKGLVQGVNVGFGVVEAKLDRFADGFNIADFAWAAVQNRHTRIISLRLPGRNI